MMQTFIENTSNAGLLWVGVAAFAGVQAVRAIWDYITWKTSKEYKDAVG